MYKSVIAVIPGHLYNGKKGELIDVKPVNLLANVIKNLVSKLK